MVLYKLHPEKVAFHPEKVAFHPEKVAFHPEKVALNLITTCFSISYKARKQE